MRFLGVILALVLLSLAVSSSSAMVLGLDWGTGVSPVTINYMGADHRTYAGSLRGYLGGQLGSPLPPADGTYFEDLFCVDLDHWITIPTEYEVQRLSTASLAHGGRAAWLYRSYLTAAKASKNTGAALQIALWDVVTDGGDGLGSGNFRYVGGLETGTVGEANSMLTASVGQASTASYFKGTREYGQSMIGPPPPVPEPGTWGLLLVGLGFVGAAFVRRRAA
jgi:hypothetical protein